jgi:hypothetical protein
MNNLDYLINFAKMEFEVLQEGFAQKKFTQDNKVLRLLKINDAFTESNWCMKGHVGYVLSGKMKINFNGQLQSYKQGDGLWIKEGESSKHKLIMEQDEEVQLLLFETVD